MIPRSIAASFPSSLSVFLSRREASSPACVQGSRVTKGHTSTDGETGCERREGKRIYEKKERSEGKRGSESSSATRALNSILLFSLVRLRKRDKTSSSAFLTSSRSLPLCACIFHVSRDSKERARLGSTLSPSLQSTASERERGSERKNRSQRQEMGVSGGNKDTLQSADDVRSLTPSRSPHLLRERERDRLTHLAPPFA